MATLAKIGLCELALGAMLGWVVAVGVDNRQWLVDRGIRSPRRLLQCHLDLVIMGLILIAVGVALDPLPVAVAIPLVIGTWVNPLLFLPLAVSDRVERAGPYRAVTLLSFACTSGSLLAAAIVGLTR